MICSHFPKQTSCTFRAVVSSDDSKARVFNLLPHARGNVLLCSTVKENVFGVWLNNRGSKGGLLMEAFVEGVPVFQTDDSWVFSPREQDGWMTEDFNDRGWESVVVEGRYPDTAPWNDRIEGFPIPSKANWINGVSDDDGYFRAKFKIDGKKIKKDKKEIKLNAGMNVKRSAPGGQGPMLNPFPSFDTLSITSRSTSRRYS